MVVESMSGGGNAWRWLLVPRDVIDSLGMGEEEEREGEKKYDKEYLQ